MQSATAPDSLPDAAASRARLDARIVAARAFPPPPQPAPRPARVTATAVPELPAAALTGTQLREAIAENGALLVRGLLPTAQHAPLRSAIDAVLAAREQQRSPWFDPPPAMADAMAPTELSYSRAFHRQSGSAMCADAPSVAEHLLALYEALGLDTLAAAFLDDRPCLSVKKWVLRRSHTAVEEAGWHQDGAFMGAGIQSINLWLPLTDCGADTGAPGLDIIPARIDGLLQDGEGTFDWSVSPAFVERELPPRESPRFAAGDALFFDHFFLHRTQYRPRFSRPRYAIETWFFAEGRAPANQVPLSWR